MEKETLEEKGKRIKDETTYEKKIMTNQQLLDKKQELTDLLGRKQSLFKINKKELRELELLIESLDQQIKVIELALE